MDEQENIVADIEKNVAILEYIKPKYRPFYDMFFKNVYFNKHDICCTAYLSFIKETLPSFSIFIETAFIKRYKEFDEYATLGTEKDSGRSREDEQPMHDQGCFEILPVLKGILLQQLSADDADLDTLDKALEDPIYHVFIFGTVMDLFDLKQLYEPCLRCRERMFIYFYEITPEALYELIQLLRAYGKHFKVLCTSIIFNPLYILSHHAGGNCLKKYRSRYIALYNTDLVQVNYSEELPRGIKFMDDIARTSIELQRHTKTIRLYRFYHMDDLFLQSPRCLSKIYSGFVPNFVVCRDYWHRFDCIPALRGLRLRTLEHTPGEADNEKT